MCIVSVIVPIYHGKKYIRTLIRQLENCWKCMEEKIDIELLLVNDAPEEPLEQSYVSEYMSIEVLNTEVNLGAQGARVKGVEYSRGNFILLLDQDDRIVPEYLRSQMKAIKACDAVVCRALHEKKPYYNLTRPFARSICKEHILRKENSIISPGQVLMRKDAISEIWKKNILKNNGADDWLLWLCMMEEGKTFTLNDEILFEHVVEGNNASLRVLEMQRSELEVLEVIRKSHIFSSEDITALANTIHNLMEMRLQLLGKFQRMSYTYDKWVSLKNKGVHISEFLRQRGYRTIAIYGVTSLGKRLYQELEMDKLEVLYFIDINADFFDRQIEVCSPEKDLRQVDVVIVSLVQNEKEVSDLIKTKLAADVWAITELMEKAEETLMTDT